MRPSGLLSAKAFRETKSDSFAYRVDLALILQRRLLTYSRHMSAAAGPVTVEPNAATVINIARLRRVLGNIAG